VTNVKTVIDGMRTQRDTSMSEMSQLKARIKEQNAKLMQLTQERAKWDAKSKASGAAMGGENAQQEQLNAAFAHKQVRKIFVMTSLNLNLCPNNMFISSTVAN